MAFHLGATTDKTIVTSRKRARVPMNKFRDMTHYSPASHFALGADDEETSTDWTSDLFANAGDIINAGANLLAASKGSTAKYGTTASVAKKEAPQPSGMSGSTIAMIVAGVALAGAGALYVMKKK